MTLETQVQTPFPTVREIADFFFQASSVGYASGLPRVVLAAQSLTAFGTQDVEIKFNIPGAKFYQHACGDFFYLDFYFVGTDGFSWGWTNIWHHGRPVWCMSYQGRCSKKEVIPFLKRCLRAAYVSREFHGGRAKSGTREGNLAYFNSWETDFTNFHGTDRISEYDLEKPDANGNEAYYHSYQGMLLIPADEEYQGSLAS